MDNEDYGEAVSGFFGVTGTAPKVLVYTGNEDMRKFMLDGELTVKNIKVSSTCETLVSRRLVSLFGELFKTTTYYC